MKKIIAILLAMTMLLSAQVFAEETTAPTTAPTTATTEVPPTPEAQPASAEPTTQPTATETTTQPATQTTTNATTTQPTTQPTATETTTVPAAPAQGTDAVQTTTTTTTETTTTTTVQPTSEPGITPDSLLYGLDKLIERIQLSLITDSVKKAEELAKISQERLAESMAMLEKSDIELSQKALVEYKANLEQAVTLVETAMESGKQVANVMNDINTANLKDAAVVEKILTNIPEQYRAEVKTEIEKIAAAAAAVNDTAQVVENKEEEEGIKQDITLKMIEEQVKDAALLAKIKEAGLNTRQIIAVISLSEQSEKPLAEVLDMFIANEKGLGATAHALGLTTKDALKGINSSFKDAKDTIKKAFKEAIKVVEEDDDKEEVEALVESSLAGQTAVAEVKAVNEKLAKVVKEAEVQVVAITAATESKKAEKNKEKAAKELEKVEQKIEKELDKVEKELEKATEKIEKQAEKKVEDKATTEDNDQDKDDDQDDKKEDNGKADKSEKSNKKN